MERKRIIQSIAFILTVISSVFVVVLLPDKIAVQWNAAGASNYLSKYVAALIAVGVFAVLNITLTQFESKYESMISASRLFRIANVMFWSIGLFAGAVLNVVFIVMNFRI